MLAGWKQQTRRLLYTALEFAFPPVCVGCKKPGSLICADCEGDIVWRREAFCPTCLQPCAPDGCCNEYLCAVYTAVSYLGPIPRAIHQLKYEGQFAVAHPLAHIMQSAWQSEWPLPELLIPVPLHPTRQKKRSFNQSALLAKSISNSMEIEYLPDALYRVRQTPPQVGLSARDRQKNVEDAFWANNKVAERSVLLIDDVYTTGATLSSAAFALRRAGARSVAGFTLAKSTLNDF